MNKYGKAAIRATEIYHSNNTDIVLAWKQSTSEIFPTQKASRNKGCPKSAYLGLCEEGLVKGVPMGVYLRRGLNLNKQYAIDAVELLKSNQTHNINSKGLWNLVMNGEQKTSNSQMDVVLSLWDHGLIVR